MTVINESASEVLIELANSHSIRLAPKETVEVRCSEFTEFTLHGALSSYRKKNDYVLEISVKYRIKTPCEDDTLKITREKIRVSLNLYFERFFADSMKNKLSVINYEIIGKELIKRAYLRSQRIYTWMISPFESAPGLTILLIVLGFPVAILSNVVYLLLYIPFAYFLLLMIDLFAKNVIDAIFKECVGMKTEREEFLQYFEDGAIEHYYYQENRSPFLGVVEVD